METFLPSEIARLVLGYLKEENCRETVKVFMRECSHLTEYVAMLQQGREFSNEVLGLSLKLILDEYGKMKLSKRAQEIETSLLSLWNKYDMMGTQLRHAVLPHLEQPTGKQLVDNMQSYSRKQGSRNRNRCARTDGVVVRTDASVAVSTSPNPPPSGVYYLISNTLGSSTCATILPKPVPLPSVATLDMTTDIVASGFSVSSRSRTSSRIDNDLESLQSQSEIFSDPGQRNVEGDMTHVDVLINNNEEPSRGGQTLTAAGRNVLSQKLPSSVGTATSNSCSPIKSRLSSGSLLPNIEPPQSSVWTLAPQPSKSSQTHHSVSPSKRTSVTLFSNSALAPVSAECSAAVMPYFLVNSSSCHLNCVTSFPVPATSHSSSCHLDRVTSSSVTSLISCNIDPIVPCRSDPSLHCQSNVTYCHSGTLTSLCDTVSSDAVSLLSPINPVTSHSSHFVSSYPCDRMLSCDGNTGSTRKVAGTPTKRSSTGGSEEGGLRSSESQPRTPMRMKCLSQNTTKEMSSSRDRRKRTQPYKKRTSTEQVLAPGTALPGASSCQNLGTATTSSGGGTVDDDHLIFSAENLHILERLINDQTFAEKIADNINRLNNQKAAQGDLFVAPSDLNSTSGTGVQDNPILEVANGNDDEAMGTKEFHLGGRVDATGLQDGEEFLVSDAGLLSEEKTDMKVTEKSHIGRPQLTTTADVSFHSRSLNEETFNDVSSLSLLSLTDFEQMSEDAVNTILNQIWSDPCLDSLFTSTQTHDQTVVQPIIQSNSVAPSTACLQLDVGDQSTEFLLQKNMKSTTALSETLPNKDISNERTAGDVTSDVSKKSSDRGSGEPAVGSVSSDQMSVSGSSESGRQFIQVYIPSSDGHSHRIEIAEIIGSGIEIGSGEGLQSTADTDADTRLKTMNTSLQQENGQLILNSREFSSFMQTSADSHVAPLGEATTCWSVSELDRTVVGMMNGQLSVETAPSFAGVFVASESVPLFTGIAMSVESASSSFAMATVFEGLPLQEGLESSDTRQLNSDLAKISDMSTIGEEDLAQLRSSLASVEIPTLSSGTPLPSGRLASDVSKPSGNSTESTRRQGRRIKPLLISSSSNGFSMSLEEAAFSSGKLEKKPDLERKRRPCKLKLNEESGSYQLDDDYTEKQKHLGVPGKVLTNDDRHFFQTIGERNPSFSIVDHVIASASSNAIQTNRVPHSSLPPKSDCFTISSASSPASVSLPHELAGKAPRCIARKDSASSFDPVAEVVDMAKKNIQQNRCGHGLSTKQYRLQGRNRNPVSLGIVRNQSLESVPGASSRTAASGDEADTKGKRRASLADISLLMPVSSNGTVPESSKTSGKESLCTGNVTSDVKSKKHHGKSKKNRISGLSRSSESPTHLGNRKPDGTGKDASCRDVVSSLDKTSVRSEDITLDVTQLASSFPCITSKHRSTSRSKKECSAKDNQGNNSSKKEMDHGGSETDRCDYSVQKDKHDDSFGRKAAKTSKRKNTKKDSKLCAASNVDGKSKLLSPCGLAEHGDDASALSAKALKPASKVTKAKKNGTGCATNTDPGECSAVQDSRLRNQKSEETLRNSGSQIPASGVTDEVLVSLLPANNKVSCSKTTQGVSSQTRSSSPPADVRPVAVSRCSDRLAKAENSSADEDDLPLLLLSAKASKSKKSTPTFSDIFGSFFKSSSRNSQHKNKTHNSTSQSSLQDAADSSAPGKASRKKKSTAKKQVPAVTNVPNPPLPVNLLNRAVKIQRPCDVGISCTTLASMPSCFNSLLKSNRICGTAGLACDVRIGNLQQEKPRSVSEVSYSTDAVSSWVMPSAVPLKTDQVEVEAVASALLSLSTAGDVACDTVSKATSQRHSLAQSAGDIAYDTVSKATSQRHCLAQSAGDIACDTVSRATSQRHSLAQSAGDVACDTVSKATSQRHTLAQSAGDIACDTVSKATSQRHSLAQSAGDIACGTVSKATSQRHCLASGILTAALCLDAGATFADKSTMRDCTSVADIPLLDSVLDLSVKKPNPVQIYSADKDTWSGDKLSSVSLGGVAGNPGSSTSIDLATATREFNINCSYENALSILSSPNLCLSSTSNVGLILSLDDNPEKTSPPSIYSSECHSVSESIPDDNPVSSPSLAIPKLSRKRARSPSQKDGQTKRMSTKKLKTMNIETFLSQVHT